LDPELYFDLSEAKGKSILLLHAGSDREQSTRSKHQSPSTRTYGGGGGAFEAWCQMESRRVEGVSEDVAVEQAQSWLCPSTPSSFLVSGQTDPMGCRTKRLEIMRWYGVYAVYCPELRRGWPCS
jgi:hypothetical protein